jgi:hypothetical protein
MGREESKLRKELAELVGQRPGWRLEPRATPGASPLWCYMDEGSVELSVTVQEGNIHLYVMATDEEIVLDDAQALTSWIQMHRADTLRDAPAKPTGKARVRSFFEWS